MDGFSRLDRGNGVKEKSAVGDVQDEAAVFRAHTDVGNLHEFRSWSMTTLRLRLRRFAHLHRQLYFRLGSGWFYFLLRQREWTRFKVRSNPNCRVHYRAGTWTRQRRK